MLSRSRLWALLLVSWVVVATSCGGDDTEARPRPTTTAPATTQSQDADDEQALRQLAEDWYEASDAIYQHRAEPESASSYLVDPYLSAYVARATEVLESGQISRSSDRSRLEVLAVSLDGDEASVTQCVIDADVLVDADGEVVDGGVYANLLESEAVRTSAGWRFRDRKVLAEEEGSERCPSA